MRESPFKYNLDNQHGNENVIKRNRNRYDANMLNNRVRRVSVVLEDDYNKDKKAILDALTISEVQDEFTMYKLHR